MQNHLSTYLLFSIYINKPLFISISSWTIHHLWIPFVVIMVNLLPTLLAASMLIGTFPFGTLAAATPNSKTPRLYHRAASADCSFTPSMVVPNSYNWNISIFDDRWDAPGDCGIKFRDSFRSLCVISNFGCTNISTPGNATVDIAMAFTTGNRLFTGGPCGTGDIASAINQTSQGQLPSVSCVSPMRALVWKW